MVKKVLVIGAIVVVVVGLMVYLTRDAKATKK